MSGGTPPVTSLNAATAAGVGAVLNTGHVYSTWSVQIETTGSPASFSVDFEGCLDGKTFHKVGASITTAGLTVVTAQPLAAARLNLTALTGGTVPTLTGTLGGY